MIIKALLVDLVDRVETMERIVAGRPLKWDEGMRRLRALEERIGKQDTIGDWSEVRYSWCRELTDILELLR